jgi:arylsulfatase A-like enzyme
VGDAAPRITDHDDIEYVIDGYNAGVRVVDDAVATLLARLEAAGVREETTVVVTPDHGEALGEHGIYAEHAFPHPPCQRVPMIVSGPAVQTAGRVDEKIYQFDLAATLCDRFGLDVPDGWDAKPFAAALDGDDFAGRDHLVCGHGIFTYGRAVYCDDWVYVRLLHPGVFSLPGVYNDPDLPGGGLELLHDLDSDPRMTENLIADRPDVAAELRALHDNWVANAVGTRDAAGEDPLARTAIERGPFLYVEPESLAAHYRETGRSTEQIAAVERAREFPR